MREHKFNNGDLLRDNVTGVEGIVMVVAQYATGCLHYGIQQQRLNTDGSIPAWEWIDESRLQLVKGEAVLFNINKSFTSGPSPSGPQM